MQSQLLRVSEFCDRYAVSRATFYRLVKRGDIVIYKVGCASRVKLSDAEAWLASLSNAATMPRSNEAAWTNDE